MNLHRERAQAAIEFERWEIAIAAAVDGLCESPDCPDLFAALAYSYCKLGKLDEAQAAAELMIELAPEWQRGFILLMEVYRLRGNLAVGQRKGQLAWRHFDRARSLGFEALRISSNSAALIAHISMITKVLGNDSEANSLALQALEINPECPAALNVYSRAHADAGNRIEAEAAVRRALAIVPEDPTFHFMLAEFLFSRNEFRDAYKEVRTALQLDPSNAEAQQLYTRILQTQNALVRGLLHVHLILIKHLLTRALALASFMALATAVMFACEFYLPENFKGVWALFLFVGFLTVVAISAEPERITAIIWFFAKRHRSNQYFNDHILGSRTDESREGSRPNELR
jgi:tetratricopeptide (TPR) repeat protein